MFDILLGISWPSWLTFDVNWAAIGLALLAVVYIVAVLGGWVMTVFGLPGNWLILVSAGVFAWFTQGHGHWEISWGMLGLLTVLALVGEGLEFLTGVLGVSRKGGSRAGSIGALVGSLIGGLAGAMVGLPIPVVGSAIGVILFASLGAFGGAIAGESLHGQKLNDSISIGVSAFWGRVIGSVAKTLVGGVMAALALVALF